jgi:hypothetical protein
MAVESQTPPQVELPPRGYDPVEPVQGLPSSVRERTTTDPDGLNVHVWLGHEPVTQLRESATDVVHPLPEGNGAESMIGSEPSAPLRIVDPSGRVSRRHARLVREGSWWRIEDLRSKNGLRQDRRRSDRFLIAPGMEIGVGEVTLIAENPALVRLRHYLGRALGWDAEGRAAVEVAIQAIRAAANQRRPLVIGGVDDLVAVARQIHLRTTGPGAPFVVCDDRREADAGVRVTANHEDPATAFELAAGGTVCARVEELPAKFDRLMEAARAPGVRARTQLILCVNKTPRWWKANHSLVVPGLLRRWPDDLRRIVMEYAADAIREFDAAPASFTQADCEWVVQHEATSFAEIEIATLRIVACNDAGNPHRAAARLGLSHQALGKWLKRRGLAR